MEGVSQQKPKNKKRLSATLKRLIIVEKLYNPFGFVLLLFFALLIGAGVAFGGVASGVVIIIVIGILPFVYGIVAYPQFGMLVLLVMSYMVFVIEQWGFNGPVGTIMDGLQVLLFLGVIFHIKGNWAIFKSPITVVILIWLSYNILEVGNPSASSRLAWVYTVREVAICALSYFVFMYHVNSIKFLRVIFVVWLILTVIGAADAFKQEYIGFNAVETAYLSSTPDIASLLFIDGHWRKFSIFADPVAFAYNMVMPSIFIMCLITSIKLKTWQKIGLGLLVLFFLDAMLFSGTRGANVLLPAAIFLLAILKYNKNVLIFSALAGIFLLFLVNVPTSNINIVRFQTAFRPNTDASYNLRKANQKAIQPYILAHPLGGGLGSTGIWGKRFSPGSYLANFPPDSGYIRVAVETGWIGLIVFCIFMFVILKTGINNYYLIENRELKTYCLAITLIIFAYNLANFPQEALVQYPSNILFYMWAAFINVTLRLDINLREQKSKLPALQPAA
jgi:putative inorganic carbon (HCO3(-)) transporter